MPHPKAILFDFGDTLVTTDPPYFERVRRALGAIGYERTPAEFQTAFLTADCDACVAALALGDGLTKTKFDVLFFQKLMEALAVRDDMQQVAVRMGEVMKTFARTYPPRAEVPDVLKEIAARGIRMAVLSNNDGRTARKCREAGIDTYFEQIIDSTVEGLTKPDPRLFAVALDKMKVAAEDTLHVGDLFGCDVLGADAAGVPVAWHNFRRFEVPSEHSGANAPKYHEVTSLLELLDIVDAD